MRGVAAFSERIQTWSDDRIASEMELVRRDRDIYQRLLTALSNEIARRYVSCRTEPPCGACRDCLDRTFAAGAPSPEIMELGEGMTGSLLCHRHAEPGHVCPYPPGGAA